MFQEKFVLNSRPNSLDRSQVSIYLTPLCYTNSLSCFYRSWGKFMDHFWEVSAVLSASNTHSNVNQPCKSQNVSFKQGQKIANGSCRHGSFRLLPLGLLDRSEDGPHFSKPVWVAHFVTYRAGWHCYTYCLVERYSYIWLHDHGIFETL